MDTISCRRARRDYPTPTDLALTQRQIERQMPWVPIFRGHRGRLCIDARDLDPLSDLDPLPEDAH